MSGTFIAVDTNILVYAHNCGSEWHAPARQCLEALATASAPWGLPWPCLHEFLAVVTNPRIFPKADPIAAAMAQTAAWMESPSLRLLGELRGHWKELAAIVGTGKIRGGAIHDARVAAICIEHGVTELWTADRDFSRMGGLRVRNPLL